ncbi:MAG: CBS domain-containing protein [Acidimicrobiia bacterium]
MAELLTPQATRVTGDLDDACIDARADVLVTRKPPGGFSLVNVVSPLDFEAGEVTAIVAAIAGGPHSQFNVQLSDHLARRMNVDVHIATAYSEKEAEEEAESLVARLGELVPHAKQLSVQATDLTEFVKALPSGALLVLGEAGGSILSRLVFGPGARLRARAQAGALVVRAAPPRVFQVMDDPVFVAPLHLAGDGLRLYQDERVAVVEGGRLVGVVDRSRLLSAAADAPIANIMEEPISVTATMSLVEAASSVSSSGLDQGHQSTFVGPWPVIDADGKLIGTYRQ